MYDLTQNPACAPRPEAHQCFLRGLYAFRIIQNIRNKGANGGLYAAYAFRIIQNIRNKGANGGLYAAYAFRIIQNAWAVSWGAYQISYKISHEL